MARCRETISDSFVPCPPQHRSESVKGGCVADLSLPAIESSRAQFEHLKSITRPWPLAMKLPLPGGPPAKTGVVPCISQYKSRTDPLFPHR